MNQVSLLSGLRSARPAASADAPRPMSFAILRNTHEAFRTSIRLQEQALILNDPIGFRAEWQGFQRALAVHVAMEDAMFDVLDEVGGGALKASRMAAEHDDDERSAARVDAALATGDLSALLAAWTTWHGRHLRHLAHEEEIVTPLTMKTGATPQARGRVVHERILTPTESLPDFDWSVGWVVRLLGEFGSTAQPPQVATRVYAWGLQNACSRSQWRRLRPVVQGHCAPELWDEMAAQFGLDGEGAIT